MNPNAKLSGSPASIVFYPVFDTLTFTNNKGEVVPSVATYTEALLAAAPHIGTRIRPGERQRLHGEPPSPAHPFRDERPSGIWFW